ncbi:amidase domain-containing protein [Cohnella terricola]|uniref:Amidase domain-containing protein n=2 Tax=Cohnella terricola TaxID=1289167 RepID=A0A559JR78_9BACL|nr:amidase domain-containing protein [Cohnella terricola]
MNGGGKAASTESQEISLFLNQVFQDRTQFLVHGKPDILDNYYNISEKSSRIARQHELNRHRYLSAWASKRNIKFTDSKSEVRIVRQKVTKNTANVVLVHREKLEYYYLNKILQPQTFGLGTRHIVTLVQTDNNKWHILREWYLDPLDENPQLIANHEHQFPEIGEEHSLRDEADHLTTGTSSKIKYDRIKAVQYANKYAGLAWGAGNNNRYNPKYRDYTGIGGDCTNFVSQVLGDPEEGGGLPMSGRWFASLAGGSAAWVRTDGLKNYLLYSGYARLVDSGVFDHIMKPKEGHPQGSIRDLQPGDLIAYELKKGDVDHFAVIVGFDDNGYPLVNCHTTDRFRVPFDLGWDKHTRYLLLHVR